MRTALSVTIALLPLVLAFSVGPALGETAPKIPKGAKHLSGEEITALFDGATMKWHNYKISADGVATYDLKLHTSTGTFTMKGTTSPATGKARVDGDKFCFTSDPNPAEFCRAIYVKGDDIYEVDDKGKVVATDAKQ